MPRPMIGSRQQSGALGPSRHRTAAAGGKLLLQRRSRRYLDAVAALDGRTSMGPIETAAILADLQREFDEKWAVTPLGYVGRCYLGPPYEVHTLTAAGDIIEHYRSGQSMPAELDRARAAAASGHYLCIEVYVDQLIAVLPDGSATVMEGMA